MTTLLKPLARSLRTILRWLLYTLEAPLMYLFGRDIFISYSQADAPNYAQQLAIDVRERVPQLSFFLDQWASHSGTTLPLSLILALRWSRMLVFIGTPNAIASPNVRRELEVFSNRRSRVVPIDVDGVLDHPEQNDELLKLICGPGAVRETTENIKNSSPREEVVTRVVNAVNFTRQDRRLRRAVVGTTLGVLAIIVGGFFVAQTIVAKAFEQERQANLRTEQANEQRKKALSEMGKASFAAAMATSDQMLASLLSREAREAAKDANDKRRGAERLRDQARSEAAKQQEIAIVRQRANQSAVMLRRQPERLAESASLAVESMSRAHALKLHPIEADTALRSSLALLANPLRERRIEGKIGAVALSPDGELAAYDDQNSTEPDDRFLRIRKVETNELIASIPAGGFLVALSNNARRVSMAHEHMVHTVESSGAAGWELPMADTNHWIQKMALSPDGKYLVLAIRDLKKDSVSTEIVVFEVETRRRVGQLDTDGPIYAYSLSFNADGSLLAAGGDGLTPSDGRRLGRTLVWEIVPPADGQFSEQNFRRLDQLTGAAVTVVAPGPDKRYLATASSKTAFVWKKIPGMGYQEIARMPLAEHVNHLAFSGDGRALTMISGDTPCAQWYPTCTPVPRTLKVWEAFGHWDTFTENQKFPIENLTFAADGRSFRTISNGHKEVRILQTASGKELGKWTVNYGSGTPYTISLPRDGAYIAALEGEQWYVHDVVSQKKMDVARAPAHVVTLQPPQLSDDASLLVFKAREKGAQEDSVAVFKRYGSSYRFQQAFPVGGELSVMEVSSEMNYVAVIRRDKKVQIRDVNDGRDRTPKGLRELNDVESFRVTADGRHLAVVFGKDRIKAVSVWRLGSDEPIATVTGGGPIHTYTVEGSNSHLMVWFDGDSIKVLDFVTRRIHALEQNGVISAMAFSPDEIFLAIADETGLVRVFDVATGDEAAQFLHEGVVSKLVFSNEGKYLAAVTATEPSSFTPERERWGLHVWLMHPRDLIDEACRRLANVPMPEARMRARMSYCKAQANLNAGSTLIRRRARSVSSR